MFERFADNKKFLIAINPSEKQCSVKIPDIKEPALSQNVELDGKTLKMGGVSFVIAEIH